MQNVGSMAQVILSIKSDAIATKEETLAAFDQEVEKVSQWMAEKCPDVMARGPLSKGLHALGGIDVLSLLSSSHRSGMKQ